MRKQEPQGPSPCRTDYKTRHNNFSSGLAPVASDGLDASSLAENRVAHLRYYSIQAKLPSSQLTRGQSKARANALAIALSFALVTLLLASFPQVSAQTPYNGTIVLNGGPGQALVFYGTQSAVNIELSNLEYKTPASLTLEFWVAPRCAQTACAFFTLKTTNSSEYV